MHTLRSKPAQFRVFIGCELCDLTPLSRMSDLFKIRGFLPYVSMLFLNAFVDLGHKITIQNTVFKTYDGDALIILTAIVNALILLPFILLFTPAGFLADKFPKNRVMRTTAWGAVVLTSLITLFYHLGWFWAAFAMTFLLAVQSAFYSPAKYGYIREITGKENLARANGVVQATTTTAILSGTLAFSISVRDVPGRRGFFHQGGRDACHQGYRLVPGCRGAGGVAAGLPPAHCP